MQSLVVIVLAFCLCGAGILVPRIVVAQSSQDQPAEVNHEYSFQVQVCRKVPGGCTQTAVSRLGAMAGDPASTANHRSVSFLGPAGARLGQVTPDNLGGTLELQSVKLGYELTLTPLYETDGRAYVKYNLIASQIVQWVPGTGDSHIPDLQGHTVTGTDKLRIGESFLIDRAGYIFEIKLLGAIAPVKN